MDLSRIESFDRPTFFEESLLQTAYNSKFEYLSQNKGCNKIQRIELSELNAPMLKKIAIEPSISNYLGISKAPGRGRTTCGSWNYNLNWFKYWVSLGIARRKKFRKDQVQSNRRPAQTQIPTLELQVL